MIRGRAGLRASRTADRDTATAWYVSSQAWVPAIHKLRALFHELNQMGHCSWWSTSQPRSVRCRSRLPVQPGCLPGPGQGRCPGCVRHRRRRPLAAAYDTAGRRLRTGVHPTLERTRTSCSPRREPPHAPDGRNLVEAIMAAPAALPNGPSRPPALPPRTPGCPGPDLDAGIGARSAARISLEIGAASNFTSSGHLAASPAAPAPASKATIQPGPATASCGPFGWPGLLSVSKCWRRDRGRVL